MTSNNENAMSGLRCENYDVKRETVHCYPRNVDRCCMWSEVAWCCRWNLSAFFKFAFVLFCYITNHLMTGPLGKVRFVSLESQRFPRRKILGKQNSLFLSRPVIKCCCIARLSLDKMSTRIGRLLVTYRWSNSNVSRPGYNRAVVARTALCLFVFATWLFKGKSKYITKHLMHGPSGN